MSETFKLETAARESFGKGAARKLRRAGQTPVVVYGHGTDPQHLSVETHPLSLIVRHANALVELDIAGKAQLVLVKDVQKDPVLQVIEHVDFIIVNKGEAVEVEVPLHVVGESFSGTNVLQELNTIRLSVPATSIPDGIEVDVEGLEEGARVLAGEIAIPSGATLLDDPEHLAVHVVVPRGAAGDDDDNEAAEEESAE